MKIRSSKYSIGFRRHRTLTIATLFILSTFSGYAGNLLRDIQSRIAKREAAVFEQTVKSDTALLIQKAALFSQTNRAKRLPLEKALLDLAIRREAAMISLMETAASIALSNALPVEQRNQLPAEVAARIEARVTLEGTLEVLGMLDDQGQSRIEHFLETGDRRVRVVADEMSEDYVTGTQLRVKGLLLSDTLATEKDHITPEYVPPQPPVFGPRSALVININFADLPSEPWTTDEAQEFFATRVQPWYEEGSFNQFSLQSSIAGWHTIDASSTTCDTRTFREQAEAAAEADGIDPAQYDHVVIAFPRTPACRWAGLAQIGGRYSWLNLRTLSRVAVHELGHNLGLRHSHSMRCLDGPLSGECSRSEYGDYFDTMGRGSWAHYHGAYRAYLGWIPESDVITVTGNEPTELVTIRSVEHASGPRVLRVFRPGTDEYFTIEMREPIGFDSELERYWELMNGVAVYLGSFREQTIIDIAYQTPTSMDAPLLIGDTLHDPESTLSITPLARENGETTIFISYMP